MKVLLILLLLMPALAQASVYRCVIDGVTTFSQTPCAEDAEKIEVKPVQPATEQGADATQSAREHLDQVSVDVRKRNINIQIRRLEDRRRGLQRQRDAELDRLKAQQGTARNNLAGATYHAGLAQEMRAVNERYTADINSLQTEIDQLRQELQGL